MLKISLLAALAAAAPEPWTKDPVLSVLADRLLSQQLVSSRADVSQVDDLVAFSLTMFNGGNCTYSDIDYAGNNPAFWPAANHTVRSRAMATGYISKASKYYANPTILNASYCTLQWWLTHNPISSNWWYNDIGVPGYVAPWAFMIWPSLTANDVALLMKILDRVSYKGYTGANLVWTAGNVAWRGVLSGNRTETAAAVAAALSTVTIAPGVEEGIKADGAFFQHGAQLYNGGYGQSFAYDVTNLLALVAGTPLAATPQQVDTFTSFLLNGSLRMIHYGPVSGKFGPGMWDVGVIGRDLSRPYGSFLQFGFGQSGQQVSFVTSALSGIGGSNAALLDQYAAVLNGSVSGPPDAAIGHRHYWIGDYTLKVTRGWMASLRMQSSRTLRCECVNGENQNGLHLADGALYTYQTGLEYAEFFPQWNWERIPGTTVKNGAVPLACASVQGTSTNSFTGGVSDGDVGLSLQDFTAPENAGLRLRRHVAFQSDSIAVVLANITSWNTGKGDNFVVTTSIDSKRLDVGGGVYVGSLSEPGNGRPLAIPGDYSFSPSDGVQWVWHNGTGFVIPLPTGQAGVTLRVRLDPSATGNWGAIGTEASYGNVSWPLFDVWTELAPGAAVGAFLGYTIVPAVSLADFQSTLEANSAAYGSTYTSTDGASWIASVRDANPSGVTSMAISAFVNGTSDISTGANHPAVTLSAAGAYLIKVDTAAGKLSVSVANPQQSAWATKPLAVSLPSLTLHPSSGAGFTCGASGLVTFTTPPTDGSSFTAVCSLAAAA